MAGEKGSVLYADGSPESAVARACVREKIPNHKVVSMPVEDGKGLPCLFVAGYEFRGYRMICLLLNGFRRG